ncbi:MAG: hypothetical protein JRF72_05685 [Deltaproteobacteria bacterium]|nr:hypothetical protein [Deltaproteobacteria bacterium]
MIDDALEKKKQRVVAENLMAYRDLLSEHIRKEDEILYPWTDNQLSTHQIGELFSKFNQADQQIGVSAEKYEAFIDRLENKFK